MEHRFAQFLVGQNSDSPHAKHVSNTQCIFSPARYSASKIHEFAWKETRAGLHQFMHHARQCSRCRSWYLHEQKEYRHAQELASKSFWSRLWCRCLQLVRGKKHA